jgi:hypothetical protein
MSEPTITCPACRTEIRLTESLAAPLLESTRREFEQRLAKKDAAVAQHEAVLRKRETELARSREALDEEIAARLGQERVRIAAEESRKAAAATASDLAAKGQELAELKELLVQRDAKLADAQKAQAEVLRKQRELDDARRELELTVEQRVAENLTKLREQTRREVEGQLGLKLAEKEQTIAAMQRQVEELKRKAEQGSQQLQGEVQELELEAALAARFPLDTITPVPKGRHGGDVLQSVHSSLGQPCGTILWEAKRTRHWSEGWLAKLRADQRSAKAELAVIISQALPPEVDSFALVDQVWVAHPSVAIPLATALRQSLVELALARQAGEGQQTKMAMVYQYLTGPAFRQRVQAIVEAFTVMQRDLDQEKRVLMKQWAKREAQIERVMQATVGMYGDLQGIAGRSLQEIEGLELAALEGPEAGGVVDQEDAG